MKVRTNLLWYNLRWRVSRVIAGPEKSGREESPDTVARG